MKQKLLIVAVTLLAGLSAWSLFKWLTYKCPKPSVPEVSRYGTLTNLKDDKGRRIFSKPIQEGFYLRYREVGGEEQAFYAIGDRVSDPKASYSGYQEKISGAGITTQNELNVTSGFVLDQSTETLSAIRTVVNLSKDKTFYLNEVKNYSDPNLRPLSTVIGGAKKVAPLPTVIGVIKHALPSLTGIDTSPDPNLITDNCWPCQPWPDCDLINLVLDPTKATIVCISCKEDVPGLVHTVCLADLDEELKEYKEKGCDHPIKLTGVSDSRSAFAQPCPTPSPTVGKSISKEVMPETGQGLSAEALKQVMPETGRDRSEEALKQLLTLPAGAAIVIITKHKIILPGT
jgi:hypothetical protein